MKIVGYIFLLFTLFIILLCDGLLLGHNPCILFEYYIDCITYMCTKCMKRHTCSRNNTDAAVVWDYTSIYYYFTLLKLDIYFFKLINRQ